MALRGGPGQTPEHRLERLIERLPQAWRAAVRWLRRPSSRWGRIPAGVLLLVGSLLAILPFFGLWMLPLGLLLLAEDVPPLRRARDRVLDWIARARPHWFAGDESGTAGQVPAANRADRRSAQMDPQPSRKER